MGYEDYDKAVKHFANGLSLIDFNEKLISTVQKNVPQKICGRIKKQIQEIQTMLAEIQILKSE